MSKFESGDYFPMVKKSEQGITIIEALAATVILGIVVVVFINLSSYSFLAEKKNDTDTALMRIAEEQLNLARDYVLRNGALPPTPATVSGYTVTVQSTLATNLSYNYDESHFSDQNFSLQAMILLNNQPQLLTVTLSWEEQP